MTEDYRQLLRSELEARIRKNPRYSLRAFARDLGISPPRLSHILKGNYGLSRDAARQIAKRLGWNEDETEYFCDLVDSLHARSKSQRAIAKKKAGAPRLAYRTIEADQFKILAEWHHFAILELTVTRGFRPDSPWIARRLGISRAEAESAVERLLAQGLLVREGSALRPSGVFFANPKGTPSEAIRSFHRQILDKATAALASVGTEARDSSAVILSLSRESFAEAKKDILKFRNAFDRKYSAKHRAREEVYCLATHLLPLSAPEARS